MAKKLREKLGDKQSFTVIAELSAGAWFNFAPIEKFLVEYRQKTDAIIPKEFDFSAISVPHNPGGTSNIVPTSTAGCNNGEVRPLATIFNGYNTSSHIYNNTRNKMRRNAPRPFLQTSGVRPFKEW